MNRVDPWFDSLYLKYAPGLVRTAAYLLKDRAVAEEITQEVFVLLLLNREKVESYRSPGAWLYKVLYHCVGNEIQRARRHREVPIGPEHEAVAGDSGEFSRFSDLLPAELSREDRQILTWYYEDGRDCNEIGALLHCSAHACETRLYRARNRCKALLLDP
jgi:RNA polymerase sigma-70 factor (ECF subfamily)